jgi:hypothetical protein
VIRVTSPRVLNLVLPGCTAAHFRAYCTGQHSPAIKYDHQHPLIISERGRGHADKKFKFQSSEFADLYRIIRSHAYCWYRLKYKKFQISNTLTDGPTFLKTYSNRPATCNSESIT